MPRPNPMTLYELGYIMRTILPKYLPDSLQNAKKNKLYTNNKRIFLPSLFGGGGFRVAQLVRMLRFPSHCPFIPLIAVSASCQIQKEHEFHFIPNLLNFKHTTSKLKSS